MGLDVALEVTQLLPLTTEGTIHHSLLPGSLTGTTNVEEAPREVIFYPSRHKDLGFNAFTAEVAGDGERRRKKRNRWGDAAENKAAGLMGLPTMIKANMTTEQLEAYTLHLRIQEISEKLRINDVVPADGDRYVHPGFQFWTIVLTIPQGHHRLRLSMTTLVAVSTLANTAIASASKMSVTSRLRRL